MHLGTGQTCRACTNFFRSLIPKISPAKALATPPGKKDFCKTNIRNRAETRNYGQLDLFTWSPTVFHTDNHIARKLADRYRITIPHAVAVAHLLNLASNFGMAQ